MPGMAAEPGSGPRDITLVESVVADWGRQLGLRWSVARAVKAAAVLLLLPLGAVIADHAWTGGLPGAVLRSAGIGWAVCGVLVAAGLLLVARRRRPNAIFSGRLLERGLAIRHNALINALALRRARDGGYALDAAARQASRALQRTTEWPSPPATLGARTRLAVVAVAAAWLLYAFLAPKSTWQSLLRFAGFDLAPPTATRIERIRPPPGEVVAAGAALELAFGVSGRRVDQVTLVLHDAAPRSIDLRQRGTHGSAAVWTCILAAHEVARDIPFTCHAGDARLSGVIPVAPRPAVIALRVFLEPPPDRGSPHATDARDLLVWRGTHATFDLQANTALRDPVFVFRGDPAAAAAGDPAAEPATTEARTRMRPDADNPDRARVRMMLDRPGRYRFEFSDQWATPFRDSSWYRVELREPPAATPDTPSEPAAGREAAAASGEGGGSESESGGAGSPPESGNASGSGSGSATAPSAPPSSPAAGENAGHDGDRRGNSGAAGDGSDGDSTGSESGGTNDSRPGAPKGGSAGERGADGRQGADGAAGERDQNGESGPAEPTGGMRDDAPSRPGATGGAGRRDGGDAPNSMPPGESADDRGPVNVNGAGSDGTHDGTAAPLNPNVGRSAAANLQELLLRGEMIPESALLDAGLAPEAARSFAGALRRLNEVARALGVRRAVPAVRVGQGLGDLSRQSGRGLAEDAAPRVGAPQEALQRALERIAPRSAQSVPPELRAVLEAYYRSLAAGRHD